MTLFMVLTVVALSLETGFAARTADSPPMMTVTLKPGPADQNNRVGYVDVTISFQAVDASAGAPLLSLPFIIANIETVARTLTDLRASDANGALVLESKDDPGDVPLPSRRWMPTRPVNGDLAVLYRAPIANTPPTRSGPPWGLQTEGGGFSGAGYVFVLMLEKPEAYGLAVRWDLSEMGAGNNGSSSFGDGNVEVAEAGAAANLLSGYFMAGPMRHYPERPAADGFSSVWVGTPPFDPLPLMTWTENLYAWYRSFFKVDSEKPYRVFLRYNPVNPNGGVGMYNSFVATFDEKTKPKDLEILLAHEMFHTFSPSLGSLGGSETSTQWFSEGLAIYYQRLLPLRAGLISIEEFLTNLNQTAGRYYTNLLNDTPNDQIFPRFWEDTRIRVLPYDRGSMYLSAVNEQIRKASGGKRSLDDLIFELLERTKKGLPNDSGTWVEMLSRELGPSAKLEYEDMLAGAVSLPDSDAFGPCFERRIVKLRRFEMGFDPKVMNQSPRIIRGLVPGSEAERAGLRDGDEITRPVGLDSVQEDQRKTLTLQIRRGDKIFPVTYLPRGEMADAYQWVRVPGVPDAECRH